MTVSRETNPTIVPLGRGGTWLAISLLVCFGGCGMWDRPANDPFDPKQPSPSALGGTGDPRATEGRSERSSSRVGPTVAQQPDGAQSAVIGARADTDADTRTVITATFSDSLAATPPVGDDSDELPPGRQAKQRDAAGAPVVVAEAPLDLTADSGLDLMQAESLALNKHPQIAEARAQVENARGAYVQAGLPFNPVLQYQSAEIGNGGASGIHQLQMSQTFVTADKLGLNQRVQAQAIRRQLAELEIAELQVLTRVRAAYAAALVAQRRVELAEKIVDLARQSVASVEALFAAQEVAKTALLQAQIELQQAQISHENAQTQLQSSRRSLAAAIGDVRLPAGPLTGEIGQGLTDEPWEPLLADIESRSPVLSRAGADVERARWALQLASAQVIPNITGQVGVGVAGGTDDAIASAGISVPLPIRNRNQGNIRSARANIAAASASLEVQRLNLQQRLADSLGSYQVAYERYQRLISNVVPNAEETFELSRTAFEAGEIDYLQLLTAQRTLFSIRLEVLENAAAARQALADIEGALVGQGNFQINS